jgi:hypothetical protein
MDGLEEAKWQFSDYTNALKMVKISEVRKMAKLFRVLPFVSHPRLKPQNISKAGSA